HALDRVDEALAARERRQPLALLLVEQDEADVGVELLVGRLAAVLHHLGHGAPELDVLVVERAHDRIIPGRGGGSGARGGSAAGSRRWRASAPPASAPPAAPAGRSRPAA